MTVSLNMYYRHWAKSAVWKTTVLNAKFKYLDLSLEYRSQINCFIEHVLPTLSKEYSVENNSVKCQIFWCISYESMPKLMSIYFKCSHNMASVNHSNKVEDTHPVTSWNFQHAEMASWFIIGCKHYSTMHGSNLFKLRNLFEFWRNHIEQSHLRNLFLCR